MSSIKASNPVVVFTLGVSSFIAIDGIKVFDANTVMAARGCVEEPVSKVKRARGFERDNEQDVMKRYSSYGISYLASSE